MQFAKYQTLSDRMLQWGRGIDAAEMATPLSYSVFKDLRKPLRAVHAADRNGFTLVAHRPL